MDMPRTQQHMDISRKRRRQSSAKQDTMRRPLRSSCGTLSTSLQESKGWEQEEQTQLSHRVTLSDLQQPTGRDDDLGTCESDAEAQEAVAKRTRQAQRRSEVDCEVVTHDCKRVRDDHIKCQRHQSAEAKDQATVTLARRARQSGSMKHDAFHDLSQQSTAYIACHLHASSDLMTKNLLLGMRNRLPGRVGKRRSGTTTQFSGDDHNLQHFYFDCAAHNAVSEHPQQGERCLDLLPGDIMAYDHQKEARDLEYQCHHIAESEDQTTPLKRACHSSCTVQHHQSSVYSAINADLYPSSQLIIRHALSAGTRSRFPGRIGKRKSDTGPKLVSDFFFAFFPYICTIVYTCQ